MKASILIPTCNFEKFKSCIKSIMRNTDLEKKDLEIIVSMNGCGIEAIDYVKTLGSRVRFVWFDKRMGAVTAVNLAAKVSDSELFIRIDDDVTILDWGGDTWVDYLIQPFFEEENVGQTGPVSEDSWGGYRALLSFVNCTSRRVWEELNGLDEAFNPGLGEDLDFSIRVQKAGYKIIQSPKASEWLEDQGIYRSAFPVMHMSHGEYQYNGIPFEVFRKKNFTLLWQRYGEPTNQFIRNKFMPYVDKNFT
jgi:glycosyltransferase involved in cell wall biosynthesis